MTRLAAVIGTLLVFAPASGVPGQEHPPIVTIQAAVERPVELRAASQLVPWRLVTDLTQDDFEIATGPTTLPVASFSTAGGPAAIVLLFDVSASSDVTPDWLLEPVQKHLAPALPPGDTVRVGRFGGGEIWLSGSFVAGTKDLVAAAREALKPPRGHGPDYPFGLGPSPLWDAVDAAVTALEPVVGRRAIIAVTDGRSTANVHGLNSVLEHAVAAGISVNVVASARDEVIRRTETTAVRVRPSVFLDTLTDVTGGAEIPVFGAEAFRPHPRDEREVKRWIGRSLARIVDELHATYSIGFVPPELDGRLHPLEVRVRRPGLKVRARRGYLAVLPASF